MEEKSNFWKTKIIKCLKIIWEIIYYGLIYSIGISNTYNGYNEIQVSQGLLTIAFILILYNHKTLKNEYKNWESMINEKFYSRFMRSYKLPILLPQLVFLFVIAKYCTTGTFIILLIILFFYELWDRRYIGYNIKQDMILELLDNRKDRYEKIN